MVRGIHIMGIFAICNKTPSVGLVAIIERPTREHKATSPKSSDLRDKEEIHIGPSTINEHGRYGGMERDTGYKQMARKTTDFDLSF